MASKTVKTAKDLRSKSVKDLKKQLLEAQKKLVSLRFSNTSKQLKNFNEITQVRKFIARVNTILRERELLDELEQKAAVK